MKADFERVGKVDQVLQDGFGFRTLHIIVEGIKNLVSVDIVDDRSPILPGDEVNWDFTDMWWKGRQTDYYQAIPRRVIKVDKL